MKLNKNTLLIIAILAIGIFVLPQTLSMFAGQHSWYDPKSSGIPCEKCHILEEEELAASNGPHSPGYTGLVNTSALYNGTAGAGAVGGSDFWGGDLEKDRCYGCHQRAGSANTSYTGLSGVDDWDNLRNQVHAAYAVACLDCHPWVETELKNVSAAHKPFYEDLANDSSVGMLQNQNKACIGCHTHVGVNLSWTRAAYVSYNVTVDKSGYNVTWNQSDDLGENATQFRSEPGY